MLYYFLYPLSDVFSLFNLFRYITVRAAGASVTAFLLSVWLGPMVIRWLRGSNISANQEREHAQKIHEFYKHKGGVPTMGGVLIVVAVVSAVVLWADLQNSYINILLAVVLWFAIVGFIDDKLKLSSKSSKGMSTVTKVIGQVVAGLALGVYLYSKGGAETWLYLPFLKKGAIYLGILFIPFVVFVLVGSSNAINLTDGLDGLAIGCFLFATGAFAIVSYIVGRIDYATYLGIPYIAQASEVTVFCAALVGASAGFLWYNSYPAEVIMGDTGSLSMGGVLGAIAILLKKEALLVIVGGIFVFEALSVILQVFSFKLFKRRIFLMSPFHHHLQLKGWPESKVTIRLWIIALILAVIGLSTLKVQ